MTDFHEPLGVHGRWVVVGSFGRCWVPARVEAGWRPYANGYWQRTDAGWYWMSDEPWGWATYHYGRWDWHAQFGWFWVPQTQWAPAWVTWREGGGYVGWAPLRPSVTIGVSVSPVHYEPAFASRAFVFVEHRRMLEPVRPKTVVVNNTTIINKTVNLTNVKVVNKTVINEGPRPEVIERESGRKVQAVPAHEFRHREEVAVAARERNIPTDRNRQAQAPARIESHPRETKAVPPPVVRQAEKPAVVVTQPVHPSTAPARSTTPPLETGRPARDARQRETDTAKKITPTPPRIEPQVKPEIRPAPVVSPRRDVPPAGNAAAVTKPTPPSVTVAPARDERKREATIEKQNATVPAAAQPRRGNEVRPATDRAPQLPVKVETAPPASTRQQAAPPAANPAAKRLMSPKEKARAGEQTDARMKEQRGKRPKNQGETQETTSPADRTSKPR